MINNTINWKNKPMKYLESKFLILVGDFSKRSSLLSGTKVRMPFSRSLLSLSKKKEIKITENNPILKLPKALMKLLMNSGINLKSILEIRSASKSFFSIFIFEFEKYSTSSAYRFSTVAERESIFKRERL